MEQQGASGKASRYFGIRLNAEDQERLARIIRSGLAENISDALRCGLFFADRAATRLAKRKRSDA